MVIKLSNKRLLYFFYFGMIFILANPIIAKDRTLLMVCGEDKSFLPEIETILKNMRDYHSNKPIFSKIINLNTYSINRHESGSLDELIRFYESTEELRKRSRIQTKHDTSFVNLIRKADTYLRIEVLPKGSLLEYQLIITDSLPKVNSTEYPILITGGSRFLGFVIDISQEDLHRQLENSLKKFFPKSNRPPQPIVKLNKKKYDDGYYYYEVDRQITIDASDSYDIDSPRELLEFRWQQINPDPSIPLRNDELISLDPFAKKQELRISKAGKYNLSLIVYDGISYSDEVIIELRILNPPHLDAKRYHDISSFRVFKKNIFSIPLSVTSFTNDSSEIQLIEKKFKPNNFLIFKEKSKPLSDNTVFIEPISIQTYSIGDTSFYKLKVRNKLFGGFSGSYQFSLIAKNIKAISDTLTINVNYKEKSLMLRPNISFMGNFQQVSDIDTNQIVSRVVAFSPSLKISLSKKFSVDLGYLIPIYNSNDSVFVSQSFLSFNFSVINFPIFFSPRHNYKKIGLGFNINLKSWPLKLPFNFGYIYFPFENDKASFVFNTDFDVSPPKGNDFLIFSYLCFAIGSEISKF